MKNFLTRTFTSIFIFLIFGAIVVSSFFELAFVITISGLCAFCVYEAVHALGFAKIKFYVLPILYAVAVPLSFYFACGVCRSPFYFLIIITFIYIILFNVFAMKNFNDVKYKDATSIMFLTIVITTFLSNIIVLRRFDEHGLFYMIVAIVCFAWATDIFAYLVGMLIGKHKFSPHISPKKSIEGSIGGTLFSIAATLAAAMIYKNIANVEIDITLILVYALLCSLAGQIGDFSFSYVKRSVGIKDYGNLLPGHGGVLDRLDSLIFITPFFYMLLTIKGFII